MKRQVKASGAQGIVIGLSGGVDSSVVAALAVRAAGKKKVCGLILPCYSNQDDRRHAARVARMLGIRVKTIDLAKVFDPLCALLPRAHRLARSNPKPRLRMLVLYYYANALNYLVAGTGNRSELMVGYFTKYGDGAVDILPIAGLLKKEVVMLARELGIPEEITTKPPSAGLWDAQTDEGEMGMSYAELDDILERLGIGCRQRAPRAQVAKVNRMIRASGHKRRMPQIGPVP